MKLNEEANFFLSLRPSIFPFFVYVVFFTSAWKVGWVECLVGCGVGKKRNLGQLIFVQALRLALPPFRNGEIESHMIQIPCCTGFSRQAQSGGVGGHRTGQPREPALTVSLRGGRRSLQALMISQLQTMPTAFKIFPSTRKVSERTHPLLSTFPMGLFTSHTARIPLGINYTYSKPYVYRVMTPLRSLQTLH
jgi:hypothetical protein